MGMKNCDFKSYILLSLLFLTGFSEAQSVSSVNIVSIGQTLKEVTNPYEIRACKKFRPTKEQVINFFNHAYPVESHFADDTRYSSCYAQGDVKYGDQLPGKWMLYSSGIALLVLNDERSVNLFYDHNQWHDPNGGTYDIK